MEMEIQESQSNNNIIQKELSSRHHHEKRKRTHSKEKPWKCHQKKNLQATLSTHRELILQLVDLGHLNAKLLLKLAYKFNGEKSLIIKELEEKDHKNWKSEKMKDKFNLQKYLKEFAELINRGYNNANLIQKALKNSDGNLEKAEEFLKYKEEKFAQKFEKRKEKQEQFQQYKDTVKFLLSHNVIAKPAFIVKAAKKSGGNDQETLEILQEWQNKKEEKFRNKSEKKRFKKMYRKRSYSSSSSSSSSSDEKEDKENRKKRCDKRQTSKDSKKFAYQKTGAEQNLIKQLEQFKLKEWNEENEQIETLFVDGNNLFFINEETRQLVTKLRNPKKAEQVISNLVKQFISSKKNLKNTVLIFDNTSMKVEEQNFNVLSARPQFQTSDDYLVEKSKAIAKENLAKCAFVTSDLQLSARLVEQGVTHIMKSGVFNSEMKTAIGEELFNYILKN